MGLNCCKPRRELPDSADDDPRPIRRAVQDPGTSYGSATYQHTTTVAMPLNETAQKLINASVSVNTQKSYTTAVNTFKKYHLQVVGTEYVSAFPIPVSCVINFIAWLYEQKKSPNTIATYIAGLAYAQKLQGMPDPFQCFLVKKVLKGVQNLSGAPDVRLPITPAILGKILAALQHTAPNHYDQTLLRAMFTLSFFAFLRVGEIASKSPLGENKNVIQLSSVNMDKAHKKPEHMLLTLRHFKHHSSQRPVKLHIVSQRSKHICPVRAMERYLKVRDRDQAGPLFTLDGCRAVSQAFYTSKFKQALSFAGLNPEQYKPHSFRIGAATTAFQFNIPEDHIRLMGRWRSDAVKRYFRISVFNGLQIPL